MIDEQKVTLYIRELLGEENINYLIENLPKEKLVLIYTSMYNMVGRSIRNNVRLQFSEIDEYFNEKYSDNWYDEFEDWLHKIIENAIYG